MADGDTIIIRGGSAEVEFDPITFPRDGSTKKHKNASKKITRIVVNIGGLTFDTGDDASGLTCVITAHYK